MNDFNEKLINEAQIGISSQKLLVQAVEVIIDVIKSEQVQDPQLVPKMKMVIKEYNDCLKRGFRS